MADSLSSTRPEIRMRGHGAVGRRAASTNPSDADQRRMHCAKELERLADGFLHTTAGFRGGVQAFTEKRKPSYTGE